MSTLPELKRRALEMCHSIENLPACEQQTHVSVQASALLNAIQTFKPDEQSAWLVEHVFDHTWWAGDAKVGDKAWTTDSLQAVRFSRAEDAHRVIRGLFRTQGLNGLLNAVEHRWVW